MTEVREIIETTRVIARGECDEHPVHLHKQLFTMNGELIVEWCTYSDDCDFVKEPDRDY